MKNIEASAIISNDEHDKLINNPEFKSLGYQNTIMYMSRIHSQAEFLFAKILAFKGKIFSDFETAELFEAFTIKAICDWEWYVEQIICECLKDDTSQLSIELDLTLPQKITFDECIGYINGLGYFDLKSGSNLKSIAKKILPKARNPFENISSEVRNRIDDFYILRNFVAHRSKKSKKALLRTYLKYNQNKFQEVGDFLLNKESGDSSKTIRFQDFGGSFWTAAFHILQALYPGIYKWIVRDEETYNDSCHLRFHYLRTMSPNQPK